MTLLVWLVAWLLLSPVMALAFGAFIKAGQGPHLAVPFRVLPGLNGRGDEQRGPRADASPAEDLAA